MGIIFRSLFAAFRISYSCGRLSWAQVTIHLSFHILCFWYFLSSNLAMLSFAMGLTMQVFRVIDLVFLKVFGKMCLESCKLQRLPWGITTLCFSSQNESCMPWTIPSSKYVTFLSGWSPRSVPVSSPNYFFFSKLLFSSLIIDFCNLT